MKFLFSGSNSINLVYSLIASSYLFSLNKVFAFVFNEFIVSTLFFNDVNFSDFTEKEQDNNKENKINEEIDDDEQKEKETEKEKEMEQEKYHKSYSNSKVSEEEFDKK